MALHEVIGLAGVAVMLVAYALMMGGRMHPQQARFHVLNLVGSCGMIYTLLHDWNLPTFIVEVAWAAVALYGLVRVLMRKESPRV